MFRLLLASAAVVLMVSDAQAFGRRGPRVQYNAATVQAGSAGAVETDGWRFETGGYVEALNEVNAVRAARGLNALIPDAALTEAAGRCAQYRAARLVFGHTPNDFAFMPAGGFARAAGCAAYPPVDGWLSCCMWDRATYGGAAWVMGADGKRYMHLFVR